MNDLNQRLLDELIDWLRIPSVSSGGGDPAALVAAAEWAATYIQKAGGSAEVLPGDKSPLVVGELPAVVADAPTVLIYGHYDVQSPEPLGLWSSSPFEPAIRDGRLYARGSSDDKGNFFPLLFVACELASQRALPVNIKVLIEGEEETAGETAVRWIRAYDGPVDCAVVFDADMLDTNTPALTLGVRGIVIADVQVRTGTGDLHSGMYGGSVLNAAHALMQSLDAVLPGSDGRVPEELRVGIRPPTEAELAAWAQLPPGDEVIAEVGGRPLHAAAGHLHYERNWADASVDVHGIAVGDAVQIRTMIPSVARAKVSIRLAPGQSTAEIAPRFVDLLRGGAPEGAEVAVEVVSTGEPAVFDPGTPALRIAVDAFEAACGHPPVLIRVGGSLPVLAAMAERHIPAIVSGFALPVDAVHAPDESYRLESLVLGERTARELYNRLASLPARD